MIVRKGNVLLAKKIDQLEEVAERLAHEKWELYGIKVRPTANEIPSETGEWHQNYHNYSLDTFFSGNNGATCLLPDSNDLSFQAESNDTHHDYCFKKIGSGLGQFSTCVKIAMKPPILPNCEFCGITIAQQSHHFHTFF